MWALICAIVVLAVILALAVAIWWPKGGGNGLEMLGVRPTYPRVLRPQSRINSYYEVKDKLKSQQAKSAEGDDVWMNALPPQDKDMLKYALMQRAIGDMAALQKVDSDARGYWRLFSKGIISSAFWNSVVEAEKELTQELESVKTEASLIEPTQDPQGIISEAMHFIRRYGDKLPATPELPPGADAITELLKHLPSPPGGPPGQGMPPGMPPGHARPPMPGGMPGGMPGLGAFPGGSGGSRMPLAAAAGSGEDYTWRQELEELELSVTVPPESTKRDIKVLITSQSLRVTHAGAVVVEGSLAGRCEPSGSTWTVSKGCVVVTLEKAGVKPWPSLFAAKA